MDKDIPTTPLDALMEDLAERVAEKIRERPPFMWDPEGVKWITMRQAAEKTGIDYSTIVKATNTGELPCYSPLGRKRLDPIEVDEWVREYHDSTTPPTQSQPTGAIESVITPEGHRIETYIGTGSHAPPRS